MLAVDLDADVSGFDFSIVDKEIENFGQGFVSFAAPRNITEECSFDLKVLDWGRHEG